MSRFYSASDIYRSYSQQMIQRKSPIAKANKFYWQREREREANPGRLLPIGFGCEVVTSSVQVRQSFTADWADERLINVRTIPWLEEAEQAKP